MSLRTVLCTVCYLSVDEATAIHVGEASFCSPTCQDIDALKMARPVRPRVLVAIVHNGAMVDRAVTQNFIAIGWGDRIPRVKAELGIASIDMAWFTKAPRVDTLRNRALTQALRDGFTHVLFLDADMIHPDDLFARILKYCDREIIVSGFYVGRQPPYAPVAFRDGVKHESGLYSIYRPDEDYRHVNADGLREEELIGMGCALIPLSIVRALGPGPWFEYRNDHTGEPMISEDVPFCERVRAAGFQIYLDPSIGCGHLFQEFATEAHWTRYREVLLAAQDQLSHAMQVSIEGTPIAMGAGEGA